MGKLKENKDIINKMIIFDWESFEKDRGFTCGDYKNIFKQKSNSPYYENKNHMHVNKQKLDILMTIYGNSISKYIYPSKSKLIRSRL